MKRIIAVLLAVVLVLLGSGTLAYAVGQRGNEVSVDYKTIMVYHVASGDVFVNDEVTGRAMWTARLENETEAPVSGVTLSLDSELYFDEFKPGPPQEIGPPTYKWSFDDVAKGDVVIAKVGFEHDSPKIYPVTFTPGFDASRSPDETEFLQSEGTQTQTLTITLTPRRATDRFFLRVGPWEEWAYALLDAVITPPTSGIEFEMSPEKDKLFMHPTGLQVGTTYSYDVTIEVTPKVRKVAFMPEVEVAWTEKVAGGTTEGSPSVSYLARDPTDGEVGNWTWSAVGSYNWQWGEYVKRSVTFEDYCQRIRIWADPDYLWPPNHKAVDVALTVDASDPNGPQHIVTTTYSVVDEYGMYDVAPTPLPEDGIISLIAERDGKDKDGRVYTIIVTVQDAGGLSDSHSVHVIVPHDQGKRRR